MIVFGVPARKGKPSSVILLVARKGAAVSYATRATVTETSVEADLGELGQISMEFRPSGKARVARSRCGGEPVTFASGYYEGTVSFRGEEGYTTIEATRAEGAFDFLLNVLCPGSSGSTRGPLLPGAQLDIYSDQSQEGRVHLKVVKNRPAARAHLEASLSEERDGISVGRYVSLFGPSHVFDYDREIQGATVRSSAEPFSGSMRFRRGKPNRLSGNLIIGFPGRADVRVTGLQARATLQHAHWDW